MNRRGFLKGLGLSTAAVVVPTTISSQPSIPTFQGEFYSIDNLDKWYELFEELYKQYKHYVDLAWKQKDATIIPYNLSNTMFTQIRKMEFYSACDENFELSDTAHNGSFECVIKECLLRDEYVESRKMLSLWKKTYLHCKDECVRITSLEDVDLININKTYINIATEVNQQDRIRKFNDCIPNKKNLETYQDSCKKWIELNFS